MTQIFLFIFQKEPEINEPWIQFQNLIVFDGTDYFNPGATQYTQTHFYQTYDVTDYLLKGKNALVIKDKNDSIEAARKLVTLLNGIQAKVNLIYFNPYPGTTYQRPFEEDMLKFKDFLNQKSVICTIRESKGLDISAACGQLKEKEANGNSWDIVINFYSGCCCRIRSRILHI